MHGRNNVVQIQPVTRDKWEQALQISLHEHQTHLVPGVMEGLAYAYIKPWDEAFDPYVLEYNGLDVIRFYTGILQSQDGLVREALEQPLPGLVDEVHVPVYFLMAQYDYMTTLKEADIYLNKLKAPRKELIVFHHSAHYPQFEENDRFTTWLYEHFRSS
ncbi:alpha/beta fold hydrolase [Paenibacillus silvae]|uniref:alpha/beta fold hydrolase n=1 Tax=Paenibacillus silvae TaxID=1325358 RepID=UPI00197F3EAF|nr:hypothetical protein [Paenibacillus silvae]